MHTHFICLKKIVMEKGLKRLAIRLYAEIL